MPIILGVSDIIRSTKYSASESRQNILYCYMTCILYMFVLLNGDTSTLEANGWNNLVEVSCGCTFSNLIA